MGFRDSNQDLTGFCSSDSGTCRERIIDIASTQFPDGGCYHQYQPLNKRGNNDIGGGFNDDPLWLILGTVSYIKETGDLEFWMSWYHLTMIFQLPEVYSTILQFHSIMWLIIWVLMGFP